MSTEPLPGAAERAAGPPRGDRRSELRLQGGLRAGAARGSLINGVYLIGVNVLGLLKTFIVAGFLTTVEYGVWALLAVAVTSLLTLKNAGISDKYIQQNEGDQERAFQKAFTLELAFAAIFTVLALAAMPLLAVLTGEPKLLAPGLVLALAVPAIALQAPVWVFYRRMQFGRQRILQSIDPVVSLLASVGLAAAGFGYWSLVIGTLAGSWSAAIAIVSVTPYRLTIAWDSLALREYFSFSWPLLVAAVSTVVLAQATLLLGEVALGLAGVGAIYLAISVAQYVNRVDEVLTQTLYPAICAVADRLSLLAETFFKSNLLAMLWGVPFGVGAALFAPDLIEFGLGERWRPAELLLQVIALTAAANQIGFNWNAYFQARGRTGPIAVAALAMLVATGLVAFPLLFSNGLGGLAVGIAAANAVVVVVRLAYVRSLFPLGPLFHNFARAVVPTAVGVGGVMAVRAFESGERAVGDALAEFGLFLALVLATTAWSQRGLIGEMIGYIRLGRGRPAIEGVAGAGGS